ncbi:MAG: hypothetical protein WD768_03175 [Phycisphaeraceae bacterium]
MRTFWTILTFVLLINALAVGGFIAWLNGTDRLSHDRMTQLVGLFSSTIEEEKAEKEAAEATKLKEETDQREVARLQRIAEGPAQVAQQIAEDQEKNEVALQRYERLKRDIEDLRRSNELARRLLEEGRAKLDAERLAFEQILEKERKRREDEDFKQAVKMYESLRAKQVKELFSQLMSQGRFDDVLQYLGAMQLRKAAAVISEFKEPPEAAQAADLIQRLRERGVDMLSPDKLSAAADNAP